MTTPIAKSPGSTTLLGVRLDLTPFAGLMLASTLLLGGCNPDSKETQINARLRSPDGKLEAVYAEDLSGGPATGVSEDVYIVPPGRFPRLVDRVFSNECVHDLALRWTTKSDLNLSYSISADIHEDVRRPSLIWWAPWLWSPSPAAAVRLHLERMAAPAGSGC